MTDIHPSSDPRPADPPPQSALAEAIDNAVRRIATASVIAGAIVGLAVYARPGPPRFEAFAQGDRIVRIDTRKGSIIACEAQRTCQLVLRSGQRVTRVKRSDAPALPAPAPATPVPAAPAAER